MKIKTDFITNSSSSSFIAWGVEFGDITFSDESLLIIFNKLKDAGYRNLPELNTDADKILYAKGLETYEKIYTLIDTISDGYFEWHNNEFISAVGINKESFMEKHPDIKIKEIRSVVAKELSEVLHTNIKVFHVGSYEECWYDG
jgi:hypothetical protein